MTMRRWLIAFCGAAAVAACHHADESAKTDRFILPFDSAMVRLTTAKDTLRLLTELANTEDRKTLGLMERYHLADSAGMLFTYDSTQPPTSAFWMFRTRIPLDIAFMDSTGKIETEYHMVPCTTMLAQGCATYPAGAPYRAALEVNAGYFARHGVVPGDRLLLADTVRRVGGSAAHQVR